MIRSENPVVLVDGAPADVADLAELALVNYAHFTAMQVRGGRVRGLALHLRRLRVAHAELFETAVDVGAVGLLLRAATAGHPDCYLRVTLFEVQPGRVSVITGAANSRAALSS